jgi:voltage-gated potassium channel
VPRPGHRLYIVLAIVTGLIVADTAGYMIVGRMSFIDALYMTVITITTAGYEEVQPLDTAGRVFTMALIFTGVGTAYYLFGSVTEAVVGGQLRALFEKNAMNRRIHQLERHVILCGYGRFGQIVAGELRRDGIVTVVVENEPAKERDLIGNDELYILGSALNENVLDQAGISRAADIVIATASDPDNVYISLSARSRNADIRIRARAESEIGLRHLHLAGVQRAISSYQWSALRIANAIARPSVVDFLGLILPGHGDEQISIEEVVVPAHSPLVGKSTGEVEGENERVRLVALKRGCQAISLLPASSTVLEAGDLLIAIGATISLKALSTEVER